MTIKVAHIVPSFYPAFAYGGPTESVYQLSRALARQGAEIRVLTTDANGRHQTLEAPKDREIQMADGLTVRYCRRQWPESISASFLRFLPSYVRWADLVHLEAIYSFPTLPTLLMARLLHKPVVWSARGALARWRGARRPGLKSVYDRFCGFARGEKLIFHFTSEPEREASLKRFAGLDGVVIPNGVHYPEAISHEARGEKLRLLYLGRLDPIKGIENLIEACRRLNGPLKRKWQLTIAGGGDKRYVAALKTKIGELGLTESVAMVGRVEGRDKEKLFEQADVVVVPSHLENFCIVVAEALAHGVPVVASRGAPWPRLESEGCGVWVDNDPESLARGIDRISRMPLVEMGKKGRAWMRAEFSWDTIAAQTIRVYERMIGKGS